LIYFSVGFRIADAIEVKKADLEGHIRAITLEELDQFPGTRSRNNARLTFIYVRSELEPLVI
jgi:hypothetical protein